MDLYSKMRRARRRDRTLAVARRRQREHMRWHHPHEFGYGVDVRCHCKMAGVSFWEKRSPYGCDCRKSTKGRPKVSSGLCDMGARDHIVKLRQETREFRNAALTGRGFEEPETRHWPKAKNGPRAHTIKKRSVSCQGKPGAWWVELRGYRTERDRDNALDALRKSVRRYDWPQHRQKDRVPPYEGPRYEYLAGQRKAA